MRDLCRAREAAKQDQTRLRHRVSKFLLRRGVRWTQGRRAWTRAYLEWLRGLRLAYPADQATLDDQLLGLEQLERIGTELHDWRRFASPRALRAYLGVVPSERSSGGRERRGGITKAGNIRVRRLLIETAWHYRHRPAVSQTLGRRRQGQPARVIAVADRAQHRLHARYQRLLARGKSPTVAVTAVARELVGFLWAALEPSPPETL